MSNKNTFLRLHTNPDRNNASVHCECYPKNFFGNNFCLLTQKYILNEIFCHAEKYI